MKKILITGASGFIGSFLVEEALKREYEVFAGIRSTSNRSFLNDSKIVFFESNLADKYALKNILIANKNEYGKFDYIIHNAGITKSCDKDDFEKVNYQFTRNLIEALSELNCMPEKFIFISSLAAYGPGNEKTLSPIAEKDIPHPITFYGKSKLKAEQFIKSFPNLPYLIFRPTSVYGPREKDFFVVYKTIKHGLETYIGSSEQLLSFIYVKDLCRLIFDALESDKKRKSYFLSDLKDYTAIEFNAFIKKELNVKTIQIIFPEFLVKSLAFIIEKIACLTGKPPSLNTEKYKEISAKNWLCDSKGIEMDFSFKPEYELQKGIKETIAWYKKEKLL
ncbi:MAG: NAD(P)-dependent oxidoreductase [Bacteroidales bacterium]|jgi:nucleoside-diphosphate-sugar epimerase|nr:NAD(P)-dependent oxidoreductase [Bacteroidales bacterium]